MFCSPYCSRANTTLQRRQDIEEVAKNEMAKKDFPKALYSIFILFYSRTPKETTPNASFQGKQ